MGYCKKCKNKECSCKTFVLNEGSVLPGAVGPAGPPGTTGWTVIADESPGFVFSAGGVALTASIINIPGSWFNEDGDAIKIQVYVTTTDPAARANGRVGISIGLPTFLINETSYIFPTSVSANPAPSVGFSELFRYMESTLSRRNATTLMIDSKSNIEGLTTLQYGRSYSTTVTVPNLSGGLSINIIGRANVVNSPPLGYGSPFIPNDIILSRFIIEHKEKI